MLQRRFIILNEVNESGVQGTVKLERFADQTSIESNLFGVKEFSLVVKIEKEIIVLKEGYVKFFTNKEFDTSSFLQAIVIVDKKVVATGSSYGLSNSYKDLYEKYNESIKIDNKEQKEIEVVEIEENDGPIENIVQPSFYKKIEKKMEELFKLHTKNTELETIIKDSKWVNINIDENNHYSIGIIYDNENPSLICYGLPEESSEEKPKEIEEGAQWLQLSNGGYWILYQNAETGEILKT